MIDLTFTYDYEVMLNEKISLGVIHTFTPNMLSSKFKEITFQIKKRRLGSNFISFKIV